MDQLSRVQAYFNEKERRRLDKKVKESGSAFPDMTPEEVKLSCLENNGYETPELNDKLYLHFRGFRKIENLEPYTGCKSIWLDSNGFDTIEGLDTLTELRCLYLGKNLISHISGLNSLSQLTILDLSNNRLTRIENLSCCPNLQTVNVSYNSLASPESIAHFRECKALNNIDITNNRLEADEEIFSVLKEIPSLVALSINGNEVTKLPTFRKRMLGHLPKLGYLDRPVEEHERFYANAFFAGGAEAEAAAREEWKIKQQEKKQAEMEQQRRWQEEQRQLREQARAEGRSLIREFTAEEQEERRLEAQAAQEAERRMLGLGLARLGAKVHQLESSNAGGNVDVLDAAAEALYREDARMNANDSKEREEEEEGESVSVPVHIVADDTDGGAGVASTSSSSSVSSASAAAVEDVPPPPPQTVDTTAASLSIMPPAPPATDKPKVETAETADDAEPGENSNETDEERSSRQQRIDESFAMYKQQQEALKKGQSVASYVPVDTWSAVPPSNKENESSNRLQSEETDEKQYQGPLFWTEAMDMALAKQVQLQMFDFDRIANELQELAKAQGLSSARVHQRPELLSIEACRVRWSELDAQQWCAVAPGVSAQDTIFRINVSEEILAAGYQPSYEELMQLTASMKPKYLKTPDFLPTMPSYANDSEEEKDDDDEDDEDNNSDGEGGAPVKIFKVSEMTRAAAALVAQRSLLKASSNHPPASIVTSGSGTDHEDAVGEEKRMESGNRSQTTAVFDMDLD